VRASACFIAYTIYCSVYDLLVTACSFSIKGAITGKLAFKPEEEIGRTSPQPA
jgi:hypothetical protein